MAFPAALLLVAAFVPLRWEGARTAHDAYHPLRAPTAQEAAALLSSWQLDGRPGAALVRMDADTVVLRTGYYLLPGAGGPERAGTVNWAGKTYGLISANWSSACSEHRLDRAPLEKELGRPLTDADVQPSFLADRPVSFASNRVPLYFLAEVGFLTLLLASLLFFLSRSGSRWWVIPLVAAHIVPVLLLVPIYSPAFFDADTFHQRVAVEALWDGCLMALLPLLLGSVLCFVGLGMRKRAVSAF
ncbi:hypothetical protein [Archangium lansingense]|uniref:Uncharacterized protein n=1 Tax=Archangium lansingense TaxID=2995310 RepID=A0ABT3ZYB5_9BACT|nr:hypothetical protein [Archangium lansinium]MCY1074395.1 hypothetical protein [Archangium lansinium]